MGGGGGSKVRAGQSIQISHNPMFEHVPISLFQVEAGVPHQPGGCVKLRRKGRSLPLSISRHPDPAGRLHPGFPVTLR